MMLDTNIREVQVEKIFALALRGGLSFLLGLLFGIAGLFIVHFVFFNVPVFRVTLLMMALGAGFGTGVAAFLAWLKPEASRGVITIGLALALGAAMIGAVAGYMYTEIFDAEVRNVTQISTGYLKSPAVWTYVMGGTLFSTAMGAVYYSFRLWRYHEV